MYFPHYETSGHGSKASYDQNEEVEQEEDEEDEEDDNGGDSSMAGN